MAAENDAESIKTAIDKSNDLSYVPTMDKKLSGGQDGDILFLDALLGDPYEQLVTTIFKEGGWLTQTHKEASKPYMRNLFRLIDMLRPRRVNGRLGAQASLFELVFSPEQLKRHYDYDYEAPRLPQELLPDAARDVLFHQDPETQGATPLPAPYNEMDLAVQSREPWLTLVGMDGPLCWLNVSRQELYLFLFANVVVHLKRDSGSWPLFGAAQKTKHMF
jgi:hypothetical protein